MTKDVNRIISLALQDEEDCALYRCSELTQSQCQLLSPSCGAREFPK